MKYIKLITIPVALMLSGCVGPLIGHNNLKSHDISQVVLSTGERGSVTEQVDPPIYTQGDVTKIWGAPDKITHSGDLEQWTYKGNLKWIGGMLVPIIIPLAVPNR